MRLRSAPNVEKSQQIDQNPSKSPLRVLFGRLAIRIHSTCDVRTMDYDIRAIISSGMSKFAYAF